MRYRLLGSALLLSAALAIPATPVFAQGRGRGNQEKFRGQEEGHKKDHAKERDHGRHHERERDRRHFQNRDRDEIARYYRGRRDLPPGLAKREALPPGLQRQLRRNGELPPGLRRRIVWFPRDLDRRLGPLPEGYRRCWVGDNALVVNVRTFAIADVMLNFRLNFH